MLISVNPRPLLSFHQQLGFRTHSCAEKDIVAARATLVAAYERSCAEANLTDIEDSDELGFRKTNSFHYSNQIARSSIWDQIIANWKQGKLSSLEVNAVYTGVPNEHRRVLWTRLLRVEFYRKQVLTNTYKNLLQRAYKLSPFLEQIDLDVMRTFQYNSQFRLRYGHRQRSLFNVLCAYSIFNTEVGYCQGMNYIAAMFLLVLETEEDAMWALHSVMQSSGYQMHGFFVREFPKLHRFEKHLKKCTQKYLPLIRKQIDSIPEYFFTQKILCGFLDLLPFKVTVRVWDILLVEGESVFLASLLALLDIHQELILESSAEEMIRYFQKLDEHPSLCEALIVEKILDYLTKLKTDRLTISRATAESEELPVKPFGEILKHSMVDINSELLAWRRKQVVSSQGWTQL